MNSGNYWLVFLFLAGLSGCGKGDLCEEQEVSRAASPDKVVDAVISRRSCGATTSYSYRIYIEKLGEKHNDRDAIFIADNVDGIAVKWSAPKKLTITYKKARIFNFTNFWNSKEVDNFKYTVSVNEIRRDEQSD